MNERKKTKPTALHDILGFVLHGVDGHSPPEHIMIHALWRHAVGEKIAAQTSPASIRKGVLMVNVTNSVWMQQLHFLKDEITEKLNAELGAPAVRQIKFKIGPVREAESEVDDEPLPELDAGEADKIDAESQVIDDPDLRRAFQGVMAAYLKNRKKS